MQLKLRIVLRHFALVCLGLVLPGLAFAQGSVAGTVRDSLGSPLGSARVTVAEGRVEGPGCRVDCVDLVAGRIEQARLDLAVARPPGDPAAQQAAVAAATSRASPA